jgi:isoleucyl-tRNA synthetase
MLSEWYTLPTMSKQSMDDSFWREVMSVKTEVNKVLEQARNEKSVGASLAAEVTLYVTDELKEKLSSLGDELRFVLITSKVELVSFAEEGVATGIEGLRIAVAASAHEKCDRCWHHNETVGQQPAHETLCVRCVTNVDGEGEQRAFA